MKTFNFVKTSVALAMLTASSLAMAHTPLCNCMDEGDGTVLCEGGFSDGSSASGVQMSVVDAGGKVLASGKMDKNSEFTFKKPAGVYTVKFDAGEGHRIDIPSAKIK